MRQSTPLKPYSARSSSVLPGQTDLFTVHPPLSCACLTVRMRRKGGDPLLMLRRDEPPRVPRRSKVLADAWDQDGFDTDAVDHTVELQLAPGSGPVFVGICNYTVHKRETCYYTLTVETAATTVTAATAVTVAHPRTHCPAMPHTHDYVPTRTQPPVCSHSVSVGARGCIGSETSLVQRPQPQPKSKPKPPHAATSAPHIRSAVELSSSCSCSPRPAQHNASPTPEGTWKDVRWMLRLHT